MSAQEMKLFVAGDDAGNEWLMASDEPAGTTVPADTERWIAINEPMEVEE